MQIVRYFISLVFVNVYRLLRIFPNNDPIMGMMMPYARQDSGSSAAVFAFLAMVSFDVISGAVGYWTVITALVYAGLGFWFHERFKKMKTVGVKDYFINGVYGVLIFDVITGPIMTGLMWTGDVVAATIGQVPFTIYHLISVGFFSIFLSPVLDAYLVNNKALADDRLLGKAAAKA